MTSTNETVAKKSGKKSNRFLLTRRFPPSREHLEIFARLYGVDLGLLNGSACLPGARRRPIRDEYSIHIGGMARRQGPPALAAPSDIGAVIDPSISLPISAVSVKGRMNFGNSVAQIGNAISACEKLNIRNLYLPRFWYVKLGRNQSRSGFLVRNKRRTNLKREQLVLHGGFFYLQTLGPLFNERPNYHQLMGQLSDLLVLPWQLPPLADDELVVHLRSGDVFDSPIPHPSYGQPPLAYYLKILRSRAWRSVTMVYQDEGNPVIVALRTAVHHLGIPLRCVSGSLADDLAILLSASTLVTGSGTFASGVSALSRHLTTVYCFENRFNPWGNPHVSTVTLVDGQGGYVRQVMRRNWANTPDQRDLMLRYPQEAITFTTAEPISREPISSDR